MVQPRSSFYNRPDGGPLSWCIECFRAHKRVKMSVQRLERRKLAFEAYGPACACCGEAEYAFLVLDHVNGGGLAERREHGSTDGIIRRLQKEGWPPGYQVLCANCNMAKERIGGCPHQAV